MNLEQISPQIALTGVNTLLILVTIWFSWNTTVFQKRTAVREAIEQLDNFMLDGRHSVMPSLKEFKYGLITREVTLTLQIGNLHHSVAGNYQTPDESCLNLKEDNYQDIPNYKQVVYDEGLQEVNLKLSTVNSVECVQACKMAMELVREDFMHNKMEGSSHEYERDVDRIFYRTKQGDI